MTKDDQEFERELIDAFGGESVDEHKSAPEVEEASKGDDVQTSPPETPQPPEEPEEEQPSEEPAATREVEQSAEEPAAPLTEESIRRVMSDMRNEERAATQELDSTYEDVIGAYYPDGLSNTLVDQSSGRELRTVQDVVDASGGELNAEEAAQWLMNEQRKLDQQIEGIQKQARDIAETTVNFRKDSIAAVEKYTPLFDAYPQLQGKVFNLLMRQVKADEEKGVILEAPDVMELYDTYLEPYQKAYEYGNQRPATAPVTSQQAKPSLDDRLDEGGDGGANVNVNNPHDFAQQVSKELEKGF